MDKYGTSKNMAPYKMALYKKLHTLQKNTLRLCKNKFFPLQNDITNTILCLIVAG